VLDSTTSGTAHHDEASALQTKFCTDVLAFVEVAEQLGNPFNSGTELVALHTQEVMEKEVVTSLTQVQDLGKDLHAQYVSHTIDADLEEFFRYENQREPTSLSNQGSLRSGNNQIF